MGEYSNSVLPANVVLKVESFHDPGKERTVSLTLSSNTLLEVERFESNPKNACSFPLNPPLDAESLSPSDGNKNDPVKHVTGPVSPTVARAPNPAWIMPLCAEAIAEDGPSGCV